MTKKQVMLISGLGIFCMGIWGLLIVSVVPQSDHLVMNEQPVKVEGQKRASLTYISESRGAEDIYIGTTPGADPVERIAMEPVTWDKEAINLGAGISIEVVLDSLFASRSFDD
ncbi:hypothetical protein JSY36_02325 [Bacillus sp. H-16]|uniref:hypothetical protein n=1 Tax=Alteribacter salitolerans TaxID=2912333 RepID=UPI001966442C|nr:hypothetical protein [Alteribacter salitolerans]MBM7094580.1 hypothetical protein [Alteribacter salitolerans]